MPFVVRINTDIKIGYMLVYGHAMFSEVVQAASEPDYDPVNRPRVKIIMDFRNCDLETDLEGMKMFVNFLQNLEKTGFEMEPTAYLTTQKALSIFLKALGLLIEDTAEIRQAFSSLDDAIVWLGETENAPIIHQIHDELLREVRSKRWNPSVENKSP